MLKLPTFESEKSRRVLVALICTLVMCAGAYFGLSLDEDLVEDVVEVAVEETLGPEPTSGQTMAQDDAPAGPQDEAEVGKD